MTKRRAAAAIESGTIYPIPLDQRHGRARDLFTVWFGANMTILTIATGALGPTIFKLDFTYSVLSILIGNVVGAVFMALHAAQGPQLGVPQMVQTRGQFGSYGAVAVTGIVVVMYVGFFASNVVLGGQSLHSIVRVLSTRTCILLLCIVSVIAAIFGYDLIHRYTKVMTVLSGLSLVLCCGWIFGVRGLPTDFFSKGGFTAAGFLGNISAGALWQISYAPYVSDYSRYMKPGIGSREAFWASYVGCVLGTIFPMMLGAGLAQLVPDGDAVGALTTAMGPLAIVVVSIFAVGVGGNNAMNLYCGSLSALTIVQTFAPTWKVTPRSRAVTAVVLTAIAFTIATMAAANFMATYVDFLSLLLYVLVPWTAINLVDFYLIQHGQYDVQAFFRQDGGVYGRYNIAALVCYAIGILVQIPFMATGLYTGPIAVRLHGADISWIVGLLVISPLYWFVVRNRSQGRLVEAAAV